MLTWFTPPAAGSRSSLDSGEAIEDDTQEVEPDQGNGSSQVASLPLLRGFAIILTWTLGDDQCLVTSSHSCDRART
jgi:hypothetical protein